jgi:hypothetical protein
METTRGRGGPPAPLGRLSCGANLLRVHATRSRKLRASGGAARLLALPHLRDLVGEQAVRLAVDGGRRFLVRRVYEAIHPW